MGWGAVARRPVAWVAAVVLLLEALGIVFVNGVLATVVHNQRMSLAGLDPDAMSAGSWVLGGILGAHLVLCAAIVVRTAISDRAPGRWARYTLIACAVVHGVLGALTVGLVGWTAFAFLMVVLGMLVLILVAYEQRDAAAV
ncbi:hypothetical protein KQY30_13005 [Streptomyces sp. GMY02]|uniref:hypothetical protein n=1 Tax=Streptomyces sp. GMY02 TaxID=1333528 RepID=UPI001C2BA729|nr:hypothetical protein [Streptomyces sp. GMY02]QXE35053.1 hypothetical protein KQY30_13005 [Streptomyces sp. GMY02]